MKIAHCLPDQHWIDEMRSENPRDAACIQQKYIAEGLQAHGHEFTFAAPLDFYHVMSARGQDELKLVPQTWTVSGWFIFVEKLVWNVQQFLRIPYLNFFSNLHRFNACLNCLPGHDVVLERNGLYNSGVARACKKLNLPYVMFFDADQIAELDFMGKPLTGPLRWRAQSLLRYNLDAARRIICVSEPAKKHLMDNWNVPSDKIIVLSNAVDVRRFKPDPELRTETRASLQVATDPLVVFVGSFYQWHDVTTLLKAFSFVIQKHIGAKLVLVGDGTERERMISLSKYLGIEQAVTFTGFVGRAEVSSYVNVADVAVVPVPKMQVNMWLSPMKLFEYMASGKAIIATAMGQIKDVIRDGDNGLLVPAGDDTALADAIIKLIEDVPLRTRLGEQARKDAVKNHSWEQYLPRIENVFADAITLAGEFN